MKDSSPANMFNFTHGNDSNHLQTHPDNNNGDLTNKNDTLIKYSNEESNNTIAMVNVKMDSGKLLKSKIFEFKKKKDSKNNQQNNNLNWN